MGNMCKRRKLPPKCVHVEDKFMKVIPGEIIDKQYDMLKIASYQDLKEEIQQSFFADEDQSIEFYITKNREDGEQVNYSDKIGGLQIGPYYCGVRHLNVITLDKDEKIKVIGISGTPQSGTTSLSSVLKVKLNCSVIKQDLFLNTKLIEERFNGNWATPDGIQWNELITNLMDSKNSCSSKFLIVEGSYIFHTQQMRDLVDLSLYIKLEESEMHKRQMKNKRVPEWQYREYLIPQYRKYNNLVKDNTNINNISGDLSLENMVQVSMAFIEQLDQKNQKQL